MSLNVCQLTVLTSVSMGLGPASCLQKKFRLTATGEVVKTNFQMPSLYRVELRDVKNIHELRATIEDAAREPRKAVIRGLPTTTQSVCRKDGQHFSEHPEGTPWVMLDFDDLDLPPDIDPITADAVEWAISKLPEEFRNVTYLFQHSSSAGILQRGVPIKKGLNAHVFFWLSKRVPGGLLDAHLQQHCLQTGFYQIYETANGATRIRYGYDRALFQEVQAHYIAPPDIGDGVECRLVPSARQDLVRKASDEVVVPVFAADLVRTAGSEHRRVVHDHQRANGYVRHVTQTRVGSGTATSAYYVNPKRTSQGDREFVRAELKKNGELAVLYFKDESSPGSCVVMKGHKPHMAYKPGSERMLLKELSIGAHNYVRDALKWFNEVPGHTLQLTEQGYLPPLDSFAHAKVSLVLAPTGSGKTKAVVNWIRQSKKDVPICVYSAPTIALVNQTQQDLREAGILVHYYRSLGGTPSTGVIVTTNKSLPAILRILSTNATPHALIVDEIHVGLDEFLKRQKTSERFEQALSRAKKTFLLTGTLTDVQRNKLVDVVGTALSGLTESDYCRYEFLPVKRNPLTVRETSAFNSDFIGLLNMLKGMKERGEPIPRVVLILATSRMEAFRLAVVAKGLEDLALIVSKPENFDFEIEQARTGRQPILIASPLFAVGLNFDLEPDIFWCNFSHLEADENQIIQTLNRANRSAKVDLPPINRTSHFSKKSINQENDGHESKQIQRRTDHWISEAGRGGHADQGNRPQARLQ